MSEKGEGKYSQLYCAVYMVTDDYQSQYGDHILSSINVELLYCAPETDT